MDTADIDRELQRLREAVDRIGETLLDFEIDDSRALLDSLPLEGVSADARTTASSAVTQLWRWHGLLAVHVERAETLRGKRATLRPDQTAGLEELLEGRVLDAEVQPVSLADRKLLGGRETVIRSTPDELLERMIVTFDEAKAVVSEFVHAWNVLAPRVRASAARIQEAEELAAVLGEPELAALADARKLLDLLERGLAHDPLGVTETEIERLEAVVRRECEELAAAEELRAGVTGRLAGARALLDELREAEREAQAAYRELLVKITGPEADELPPTSRQLETELGRVAQLIEAGAWRDASDLLAGWSARTEALVRSVRAAAADAQAPLDERNQLRGRLAAYGTKATALGVVEDSELSRIFGAAEQELYTAPTDLLRARDLVRDYAQRLLQDVAAQEVAR
jgi:hypothetical protein